MDKQNKSWPHRQIFSGEIVLRVMYSNDQINYSLEWNFIVFVLVMLKLGGNKLPFFFLRKLDTFVNLFPVLKLHAPELMSVACKAVPLQVAAAETDPK